ncbi:hypothetical protein chiPu_0033104, partial [Chiloscyllium punctatum]|nr:hypothetical protein [Chiloscyllium punctatum]
KPGSNSRAIRQKQKENTHGSRRAPGHRPQQAGDPQYRAVAVGSAGEADSGRRYHRRRERQDISDRPLQGRRYRRRHHDRRCHGNDGRTRPDRQPRPSGRRRLDAAAEPDQLDRQLSAWRRHHHDLRRRGTHARPAARRGRRQGDGDLRAARVLDV